MAVDYTGAEDRVRSRRTSFPAEGVDSLHANCDAMHGPLTRSSPDLRTSQNGEVFMVGPTVTDLDQHQFMNGNIRRGNTDDDATSSFANKAFVHEPPKDGNNLKHRDIEL